MIDTVILLIMFFLSKLCRICIKSGNKLVDIDAKDYDMVPFSEKLEVCTKMIINKESLSTQICMSCVHKLRVSYTFHTMCRQSTAILQGYITELLSCAQDVSPEKYLNSELRVTITPIPIQIAQQHLQPEQNNNYKPSIIKAIPLSCLKYDEQKERKKRVSKEQRCSLLKRLLTTINNDKDGDIAKKIRNDLGNDILRESTGGLKDLFIFTKEYDFGYNISNNTPPLSICEQSPLDRLEEFSKTFFYTDFTEYRETILSVLENDSSSSSDDEMFDPFDEEEDRLIWSGDNFIIKKEIENQVEQIYIEPDITIKQEIDDCEDDNSNSEILPANFVQACYEEQSATSSNKNNKAEYIDFEKYLLSPNKFKSKSKAANKFLAEIIPIPSTSASNNNNKYLNTNPFTSIIEPVSGSESTSNSSTMGMVGPSSLELLQNFASPRRGKNFYPYSLKCRTRGQPFINPQLKEQFQMRSFNCSTCNRRFKSPGYLHSHCTKMGH